MADTDRQTSQECLEDGMRPKMMQESRSPKGTTAVLH